MNPQDPLKQDSAQQAVPVPESDAAALQQIDAIESETTDPSVAAAESIVNLPPQSSVQPAEPLQQAPIEPQPVGPAAPAPTAAQPPLETPVVPIADDPQLTPTPTPVVAAPVAQPSTSTTGQPKKKINTKLVVAIIAAVVILAGAGTGYTLWQSAQSSDTPAETTDVEVPAETGGDLPGGGNNEVKVDTDSAQ